MMIGSITDLRPHINLVIKSTTAQALALDFGSDTLTIEEAS